MRRRPDLEVTTVDARKQTGRRYGPPPRRAPGLILTAATPLTFEARMVNYVSSSALDAWARLTPKQVRRIRHKDNHALAPFRDNRDGTITRG